MMTVTIRMARGEEPVGMATIKSPKEALLFAKVAKDQGLDLTIYWSHYEPGIGPGEQGIWSYEELEKHASETAAQDRQSV